MASNSMTDTETTTTENETATADSTATTTETATTETATTETATTDTAAPETADAQTSATSSSSAPDEKSASTTPGQPVAGEVATGTASSGSFVTGALALVSAGLGLASLTGTPLGDMMRAREELLGQISAATGGQIDQVQALYGSPWHTVALVNGSIAVLAVIVGAVLLGIRGRVAGTPSWVKAVALGGTVLGVIGLLVSGGMYLDLFAAAPTLPTMPGVGG